MKDGISEFIDKLKSDSKKISSYDEASTKQAIILRIIQLLGWNTSDIDEVHPEYAVEKIRVDYSLRLKNENKFFIEVKKPSEDLENHQKQLLQYSFEQGVDLASLTNGITWWFYLPMKRVMWSDRKFYTINISQQDSDDVANKFIDLLSKDNVKNGSALNNAHSIYKGEQKKRDISQTLPKVWKNIMEGSDNSFIELIANSVESMCGHKPDREIVEKYIIEQSKPIIREPESGAKKTRNGINQFELTVPTAFIKFGGFSVRKINKQYFPDKEGKEHSFKIKILGYGETDAYMSQARIKIDGKIWRQIKDKLDIKSDDKFTFKVLKPFECYEVSKVN